MLAKKHGIVPGTLDIEETVAVIRIVESASLVELPLNATGVSVITAIFVGPGHFPEKVIRHVFDGIEAQAVRLSPVH